MEESETQNSMHVDEATSPQPEQNKKPNIGVSEQLEEMIPDTYIKNLLLELDGKPVTGNQEGGGGGNSDVNNYIRGMIYDLIQTKFFKNFNEVKKFLNDDFVKRLPDYFVDDNLSEIIEILIDKVNNIEVDDNNKDLFNYKQELLTLLKNLLTDASSQTQHGGSGNETSHNVQLYDWKPERKIFKTDTMNLISVFENYILRATPVSRRNIYSGYRKARYRFGQFINSIKQSRHKAVVTRTIQILRILIELIHIIKCIASKFSELFGNLFSNMGFHVRQGLFAFLQSGGSGDGTNHNIVFYSAITSLIIIHKEAIGYDYNNITNLCNKDNKLCYFKSPIQLFNILHTNYRKTYVTCDYILINNTLKENIQVYMEELHKKYTFLNMIIIIKMIVLAKNTNNSNLISKINKIKNVDNMYKFISTDFNTYIANATKLLEKKNSSRYGKLMQEYKGLSILDIENKLKELIDNYFPGIKEKNVFINELIKRSKINAEGSLHDIFLYNASSPYFAKKEKQIYFVFSSPKNLFKKIHDTMNIYNVYSMKDINFSEHIVSLKYHSLRVPHKWLDGKERINYKTFLFIDDVLLYIKGCANSDYSSFNIIYDLYLIMIEEMYKLLYKDKSRLIQEYTNNIKEAITGSGDYQTPEYDSNNKFILKNNEFILDIIINLETLAVEEDISKLKKIKLPEVYSEDELKEKTNKFMRTFSFALGSLKRNLFNELIDKIEENKPLNETDLIDKIIKEIKKNEYIYKILKFRSRTRKSNIDIIQKSYSWIDTMLLNGDDKNKGIMYKIFNSFEYTKDDTKEQDKHRNFLNTIYNKIDKID